MSELQIPYELQNFYQQLEEVDSLEYWDLDKHLKPLDEFYLDDLRDNIATEQLCFRFYLKDGKLHSFFEGVNEKGEAIGYPNLSSFNEKQIRYLKSRIKETKNSLLLSRYNHIIYSVVKNRIYGIQAIEAYKNLITNEKGAELQYEVTLWIQAVLSLTEKTKYNINQTKDEIIQLLKDENINLYIKQNIIAELTTSRLFKSTELAFFSELCLELINNKEEGDYNVVKDLLLNAIKISNNNRIEPFIFYEKLAENENCLLAQHPDDEDFLRAKIIGEQMEYYKKAKNLSKYETARKEYSEAKSRIKLQFIEQPLNENLQRILNQEIQRKVKIMMKLPSEEIFCYFSHHTKLFPDIGTVVNNAIARYDKSFLKHVSQNVFDTNVNAKELNDDEGRQKQIADEYFISLGISVLPEFMQVLNFGVINSKLNYAKLYHYLKEFSWYGQNIRKPAMKIHKGTEYYNWLDFMAPALHHFFIQFENSILVGNIRPHTNYVLAMDSLTLKFEGALRDFVRLVGGSTSIIKRDEVQEMLLEDLLDSETVKKEFSQNDIMLFKIVFTKMGENTRNNIAHCFYTIENYTLMRMLQILLCVLRLGKYKLKQKEGQ